MSRQEYREWWARHPALSEALAEGTIGLEDLEAYADDAVSAVNSYITGVEPLVLDHSAGLESFASDVVSGATGIDALAAAYAGCN